MAHFLGHLGISALPLGISALPRGRWGLLAALGLGAALVARRRRGMSDQAAQAAGAAAGGATGAATAGPPGAAAGAVAGAAGAVPARNALGFIGEWWSDLYAEARAEWEADRAISGAAAAAPTTVGEATQRIEQAAKRTRGRRARNTRGRFVPAEGESVIPSDEEPAGPPPGDPEL